MVEKTEPDVAGMEYDWIAIDGDGHVGFFSTAGGGYAPVPFLKDTDIHDAAIEAILSLPARTLPRFAPALGSGHRNTWKLMAERGVFAFDSDQHGGPYRIVAAPRQSISASELPEVAIEAAKGLRFVHLHFATLSEVTAAALQQLSRPTL